MNVVGRLIVIMGVAGGCAYLPIRDQHTLKKGETLERIARRYQLDRHKLETLNGWKKAEEKNLSQHEVIYLSAPRGFLKAYTEIQKTVYTLPPVTKFIWPVHGRLSSPFGERHGAPHYGIDIAAPMGTPIKSSATGRVIYSGQEHGYGKLVIVYHGAGYSTIYAHASKLLAKKGDWIKRGQIIALVGSTGRSTGPHLHYEIRKRTDPLDPEQYLP